MAERELTRERLAAARDDAMAASVAKSQFLATMSHEIRTPLNGVIGLSELLNRTELTERQRRLADGIDNAGRQLLALVNDILDLSKIEAGRLELEQVDFDPRSVIEQSSLVVAEPARRKSLELVVSCQPDLPTAVRGDPVRFGQVIANLTANAVKFTASGEVVVRASLETDTPADAVVLRVEVTDTGYGLTPEVQARLFTAFSQGTRRRRASTAVPASAWPSPGRSSRPWVARSGSPARRAEGAPSGSPPRSPPPPASPSRHRRGRRSCRDCGCW